VRRTCCLLLPSDLAYAAQLSLRLDDNSVSAVGFLIAYAGATSAANCGIAPETPLLAAFAFQTTDASSNRPTGTPVAASMPGPDIIALVATASEDRIHERRRRAG